MAKKINKYKFLHEQALIWDRGIIEDEYTFTGRFDDRLSKDYATSRMLAANDVIYDNVPKRKIGATNFNANNSCYSPQNIKNYDKITEILELERLENPEAQLMNVPQDEYSHWLSHSPDQMQSEFNYKKEIIDTYLDSLENEISKKVIKVITDTKTNNYVKFLDQDYDTMDSQQQKVYDDIVKFYENKKIIEMNEEKKFINHYKEVSETFHEIENTTRDIQAQKQYQPLANKEELTLPKRKSERYQYEDPKNFEKAVYEQIAKQNNIGENFSQVNNNEQSKPMTNIVQEKQLFENLEQQTAPINNEFHLIPNSQVANLFHIPNCSTIEQLITERKKAEKSNSETIHDIVVKQILVNNSIVSSQKQNNQQEKIINQQNIKF
ncbi:MAG: hypothetical protein ACRC4L_00605 [Mycoplasma sp.]